MPALSSARTAIACTPHGGASVELAAKILHKDPKVTAVIVEAVDPADWFAGGKSLAEQKLASFWLDIRIVDGTDSRDEKADYVAAVFSRMGELLGPLHGESSVHVNDVRADTAAAKCRCLRFGQGVVTGRRSFEAPKTSPNACRNATSTSAMVTGSPRSTRLVTP